MSKGRLELNSPPTVRTMGLPPSRGRGSRLGWPNPKMRLRIQKGGIVLFRIAAAPWAVITITLFPRTVLWSGTEDFWKRHGVPRLVS